MRILLALVCLALSGAAPALETARALAASGAPHLALARVEALQPADRAAPRWAEWESLRLGLLVDLGRDAEALKRAAALPAGMPPAELRRCLLAAMRAAVAAGEPATARAYGARILWQLDPAAEEARAARLAVIDSYLAERQGDTAFRAMLRFDQDYRPIDRAMAGHFVAGLLDLGLEKDAVNWLASLDDSGAVKLRLRLAAGLSDPASAVAQARSRLAKGGEPEFWTVIAAAAAKQGDGALRVEALERLLNGSRSREAARLADELWRAYRDEARASANGARLLGGDDAAWLDFAGRRLGADPRRARAVYAHLAREGATADTRHLAQLQHVVLLRHDGLDLAALRLYGGERADPAAIDPQARYLLGGIAEALHEPALAARYWKGLSAPADTSAEEWEVRRAAADWRAGTEEPALAALRALAARSKALPEPALARALALAREMREAGKPGPAGELYAMLLPAAGRSHARDILYALGEIAESAGQPARAADYFLRAALVDGAQPADSLGSRARLAAAANLGRAGFREDARAQYEWVVKNSKDAAQVETARRELARP